MGGEERWHTNFLHDQSRQASTIGESLPNPVSLLLVSILLHFGLEAFANTPPCTVEVGRLEKRNQFSIIVVVLALGLRAFGDCLSPLS